MEFGCVGVNKHQPVNWAKVKGCEDQVARWGGGGVGGGKRVVASGFMLGGLSEMQHHDVVFLRPAAAPRAHPSRLMEYTAFSGKNCNIGTF